MKKMTIDDFLTKATLNSGGIGEFFNVRSTVKNVTGRYITLDDVDLTIDGMYVIEICQDKEDDKHYTVIAKGTHGVCHLFPYQAGELAVISLYKIIKKEII